MQASREALLVDLKTVRSKGLPKIPHLQLPALVAAAGSVIQSSEVTGPAAIEMLISLAVNRLGEGDWGEAAARLFGFEGGTRGMGPKQRQETAANALGMEWATFRTRHQTDLVDDVAGQVVAMLLESELEPPRVANQKAEADLSATIDVLVTLDPSTIATKYSVEMSGDLDSWYLALIKAKTGDIPTPQTNVNVRGDTTTTYYLPTHSGQELELNSAGILARAEGDIVGKFRKSTETVVKEICYLAVQYCQEWYPEPRRILFAIETILGRLHDPRDHDNYWRFKAWITTADGYHWNPVSVPKTHIAQYVEASAERNGQDAKFLLAHFHSLQRFLLEHLDFMAFLDDEVIMKVGLPAVMSLWIQGTIDEDPEVFLDPGNWQIRLDR